jgi:hypothetical protein
MAARGTRAADGNTRDRDFMAGAKSMTNHADAYDHAILVVPTR